MLERSCFDCEYCHEYRTETGELRTFCGMFKHNFPIATKCIMFTPTSKKTESGDGEED